jgi:class 3 adenylate cyclase
MEPRIRYAKTSDGVSIAYTRVGKGFPLIAASPLMYSNVALEFRTPELAAWYGQLSAERQLVRFDWHGMGMSERDVDNFTIDAFLADLEAVNYAVGAELVDLLGIGGPGQVMVAYAARYPERVRRLVLWSTPVNNHDILGDRLDAVLTLAGRDWDLFCETFAHNLLGWSRGETAHQFAAAIRASIDQHTFQTLLSELVKHDITGVLGQVTAPTLVLHQGGKAVVDMDHARTIASRIAHSQILSLDDQTVVAYESAEGTQAVLDFLREGEAVQARTSLPSGTAIILFADIADSTALTERLGDASFRHMARDLDAALRTIIRDHAGTCIDAKTLGDGVLAVFTSARQAIEAALACTRSGDDAGLPLHLGLHAGDVIREENNVFGGAVNIASRISGLSAPGEVLVSDTLRGLARTSAGVTFEDRGEVALKGVGEAVRVWAVLRQAQDEMGK